MKYPGSIVPAVRARAPTAGSAEQALVSIPKLGLKFKFRLYISDNTDNSVQALANLTALCARYLPNRHEIEVVDVFRAPERAKADDVRMTPTLLKIEPSPTQRIIGTLGDTEQVSRVLGLDFAAA